MCRFLFVKKWSIYRSSPLRLFLVFSIAIFCSAVFADECAKLKTMAKKHLPDSQDLFGFQCGKDIDKKLIRQIKIGGFDLIAIQPEYVTKSSGTVVYKGNRIFVGTISYTDQINDGFLFRTRVDNNRDFAFSVGAAFIKEDRIKLKYPENNTCKEGYELFAKASVRVSLFSDTISDGSCQGGTYPLEYDIVSIGKYVCKKE